MGFKRVQGISSAVKKNPRVVEGLEYVREIRETTSADTSDQERGSGPSVKLPVEGSHWDSAFLFFIIGLHLFFRIIKPREPLASRLMTVSRPSSLNLSASNLHS